MTLIHKAIIATLFATCAISTACGQQAEDPKQTVEDFFKVYLKYDFDEAAKYCSAAFLESQKNFEEGKQKIAGMTPEAVEKMAAFTALTLDLRVSGAEPEISEDGASATVGVNILKNDSVLRLVREGGSWKIDGWAN